MKLYVERTVSPLSGTNSSGGGPAVTCGRIQGMDRGLQALHLIHPDPGPDHLIELRAWGSRFHRSWHDTAEAAHAKALDLAPSLDVYFGVAPRTGRGGSTEYVEELTCVWADLDCKHHSKADRLDQLAALDTPPSILIDSGHGYHAYWLLDAPIDPEDGRRCMAALASALDGDAVGDLPRVLRVPGTTNHKGEPTPVKVVKLSEVRCSLDAIEGSVAGMESIGQEAESASPGGIMVEVVWDAEHGQAQALTVSGTPS